MSKSDSCPYDPRFPPLDETRLKSARVHVDEAFFLECFDLAVRAVDRCYDVRGSDLANLVIFCLKQNGTLPESRRKQFQHSVPPEVFDYIEKVSQALLCE